MVDLRLVEKDIKENIRAFQRQRARDKSDVDLKFKNQVDELSVHGEKLSEFEVNFKALAIVNSMLVENINMQMEAEIADLLDRRMMSLFGVQQNKATTKLDVQNTSKKLQEAQHITVGGNRSPSPRTHNTFDSGTAVGGANFSIGDKRSSVTIGLTPQGPFTDASAVKGSQEDGVSTDERVTLANEYRNAKEVLKATG